MAASSVILILNHYKDRHLVRQYAEIRQDCGDRQDVVLLSDRTQPSFSFARLPSDAVEVRFTTDDLIRLGYPGKQQISVRRSGAWNMKLGNADLPVLLFFAKHPGYRYYWIVEYDVRFTGNWNDFFAAFEESDADLLGTALTRYSECPQWSHWPSLKAPLVMPDQADRLRGFFPIYRLSHAALTCLHETYLQGWSGHMETLVPTLINRGGLRLEDIGGIGEFVLAGNENRFYRNNRVDNSLSPGTFVYRPSRTEPGDEPGKLWHPVKPVEHPLVAFGARAYSRVVGGLASALRIRTATLRS